MSDVNPCFSEDIWCEILKNLPVKTLGKCRCVCKSWHSLIVSPSFMASHLKHYTQNDANSLIFYTKISEKRYPEHYGLFRNSAQLEGNCSLHTSTCLFRFCDYIRPYFQLLGSVYGLLCLSNDTFISTSTRILLWNPILQKCIKLPRTTFRDRESVVGFGYDCRKNDHRVVRIYFSAKETTLVEVFSVQERTQRIICADYLADNSITQITSTNCFVNGFIHWFICDFDISPFRAKSLLLFNVSEEKFNMMELPETITNTEECNDGSYFGIFEYQGMLSVSHRNPTKYWGNDIARCQIWVKREYNDATSWCKILDVTPLPGISHTGSVCYFSKNDEFELVGFTDNFPGELVYYDTNTGHIKELGFRIIPTSTFSAYAESLIFLDQEIPDYNDDYIC
ncbi:F-box/kelch-repeat protein At3g23880-like [Silene latifolia]|uniref:F-box/kelch-repeat protein At3g23880-like n=1 Tax=Silene latifolia TaxID=37657 RepID=UPI003D7871CE